MKEGYNIGNCINVVNNFIVVSNYKGINEVMQWGYMSVKDFSKTKHDIGVWKIKQKKYENI